MQDSPQTKDETQSRPQNPLLGWAIAGAETQLKAWQAYQVEGARFIAKRLRANLAFLRSLAHCKDTQATSECQRNWLAECRKDYAEEWGRLVGTSYALGFADLAGKGWLVSRPDTRQKTSQSEARPISATVAKPSQHRPGLAA